MQINTDMFKRIQDIIISSPEKHDQHYFEAGNGCGTTRCVAGWAIHLWGLDNGITGTLGDVREEYIDSVGVDAIVESQNIEVSDHSSIVVRDWIDAEHIGARILGLDGDQGYSLFFNLDNDDALRMVKEYAQGSTDVQRS